MVLTTNTEISFNLIPDIFCLTADWIPCTKYSGAASPETLECLKERSLRIKSQRRQKITKKWEFSPKCPGDASKYGKRIFSLIIPISAINYWCWIFDGFGEPLVEKFHFKLARRGKRMHQSFLWKKTTRKLLRITKSLKFYQYQKLTGMKLKVIAGYFGRVILWPCFCDHIGPPKGRSYEFSTSVEVRLRIVCWLVVVTNFPR